MAEYKIPDEYYFRIHHVRPRFKGDIENVLIYMAEEISRIGECETASVFIQFPISGCSYKTEKCT